MKENKASREREGEEFNLRKELICLFPVKVATPANKGLHRRNEYSRVLDSENQPSEEYEELGDNPRKKDADTPSRSKEPLNERYLFSEAMNDEQQAVDQAP